MNTQKFGSVIKARRRVVTLTGYATGIQCQPATTSRSKITGWNQGMGRRLRSYVENFRQDFTVLGTLTYPASYPKDGKLVKADWRAFIERLRRTGFLDRNAVVWVLEFQERGAPHFHFLATDFISKTWVAENWADITGGDRRSCSRMEAIKNRDSAGAYLAKYLGKDDQKAVPKGFANLGRMWGCVSAKTVDGIRRVPVVVATTENVLPCDHADKVRHCEAAFGVRASTTERGIVIYGSEEGISKTWLYLQAHIAPVVLTEKSRGGSLRSSQDA